MLLDMGAKKHHLFAGVISRGNNGGETGPKGFSRTEDTAEQKDIISLLTCSLNWLPAGRLESSNRGDSSMKQSKFSEQQIISILREAEKGEQTITAITAFGA